MLRETRRKEGEETPFLRTGPRRNDRNGARAQVVVMSGGCRNVSLGGNRSLCSVPRSRRSQSRRCWLVLGRLCWCCFRRIGRGLCCCFCFFIDNDFFSFFVQVTWVFRVHHGKLRRERSHPEDCVLGCAPSGWTKKEKKRKERGDNRKSLKEMLLRPNNRAWPADSAPRNCLDGRPAVFLDAFKQNPCDLEREDDGEREKKESERTLMR